MTAVDTETSRHLAIIGNQGFSLLNFRGPLIADLVAQGHRVTALAPEITAEVAADLRALGAEPIETPLARTGLNPLGDLVYLLHLRRALTRLRPDAVLAYAAKPAIYGTLAAWLAGVPRRIAMIEGLGYVFMAGPDDTLRRTILRGLVKALYRFALARAHRVLFLNRDDIADFASMRLVPQEKAVLLGPIGVDLDTWRPAPPVTAPVTFTLVARLLRDKGVLEFIDAARIVRRRHSAVRFLLVGAPDANPQSVTAEEVAAWVAEGIVEWPGHVPVQPWLAQTSVFVLPSFYREGVPRSTQEAAAMARAIITTDVPGCRDTVIDGANGILVPPRDAPALAAAMQRFIDDPALIADMGRQSRHVAEQRFDVHEANRRIISVLGGNDLELDDLRYGIRSSSGLTR